MWLQALLLLSLVCQGLASSAATTTVSRDIEREARVCTYLGCVEGWGRQGRAGLRGEEHTVRIAEIT